MVPVGVRANDVELTEELQNLKKQRRNRHFYYSSSFLVVMNESKNEVMEIFRRDSKISNWYC